MEKKQAEKKIISKLNFNDRIITDINDILNAQSTFYSKLYEKRETRSSEYNFFNNTTTKINEIDKTKCEGILNEHECFISLKKHEKTIKVLVLMD